LRGETPSCRVTRDPQTPKKRGALIERPLFRQSMASGNHGVGASRTTSEYVGDLIVSLPRRRRSCQLGNVRHPLSAVLFPGCLPAGRSPEAGTSVPRSGVCRTANRTCHSRSGSQSTRWDGVGEEWSGADRSRKSRRSTPAHRLHEVAFGGPEVVDKKKSDPVNEFGPRNPSLQRSQDAPFVALIAEPPPPRLNSVMACLPFIFPLQRLRLAPKLRRFR